MTAPHRLRLAVLISGRGTNMRAIAAACAAGRIHAQIVTVIASRSDAPGLALARELGLRAEGLRPQDFRDRAAYDAELRRRIENADAELVVLAGFMRILGDQFVDAFAGRLVNIHPSLLPRHKGLHTHRRALECGDREHGASVHFVTHELDGGPVVAQARLSVRPFEAEPALSARVQSAEHTLYPRTLAWIAERRLTWTAQGPRFDGLPLEKPLQLEVESDAIAPRP